MRVIVGTYRKQKYMPACLKTLERVAGITDMVFVDDSGDPDNAAWLAQYGKVVQVGRKGYTKAMREAVRAAEGQEVFWMEEDFQFTCAVYLEEMSEMLYHRPWLAQIALLRGPHFPIEHKHGGLIEALQAKGHKFTPVSGLIEQTSIFTTNPTVIRGACFTSWPGVKWSEEAKTGELLRQGYRFAYLPGIRLIHEGERSGFGY